MKPVFQDKKIDRTVEPKQMTFWQRAEKDRAISIAYNNAAPEWKDAAGDSMVWVAERYPMFTTDEVWRRLAKLGIHTHENRAMGAVMQAGVRARVMEATGSYIRTRRHEAHGRAVLVYKSLIFRGGRSMNSASP